MSSKSVGVRSMVDVAVPSHGSVAPEEKPRFLERRGLVGGLAPPAAAVFAHRATPTAHAANGGQLLTGMGQYLYRNDRIGLHAALDAHRTPLPCSPCRPSSSVSPIVDFGDLDGNHTVAVAVNTPPLDFYTPLWTLPRFGRWTFRASSSRSRPNRSWSRYSRWHDLHACGSYAPRFAHRRLALPSVNIR